MATRSDITTGDLNDPAQLVFGFDDDGDGDDVDDDLVDEAALAAGVELVSLEEVEEAEEDTSPAAAHEREADLDEELAERLGLDGDDEDDPFDSGDDQQPAGELRPRQVGEFVCGGCFQIKARHLCADADGPFCTDCV